MARLSELGIDFDHWCFACGRANPSGLHLDFDVSSRSARTRFVAKREQSGYDGTVHGGIVTALLDETMGWAIFHQGIWGVTGRISVTFRKPVPVGEELEVSGQVTKGTKRAIETHGEVRDARGEILAEADALFLVMPEERRRELEQRYSRIDEAFAKVRAAVAAEEQKEQDERGAGLPRRASPQERIDAARRRPQKAGRAEREEKELEHGRT
jgi:uncharacterized protein (TIGR00369 family)